MTGLFIVQFRRARGQRQGGTEIIRKEALDWQSEFPRLQATINAAKAPSLSWENSQKNIIPDAKDVEPKPSSGSSYGGRSSVIQLSCRTGSEAPAREFVAEFRAKISQISNQDHQELAPSGKEKRSLFGARHW